MRFRINALWFCILSMCLSGCMLPRATDPYAEMKCLPEGPAGDADRGGATGPLTLTKAIRVALANNPELAAGAYELDASTAQRDWTRAQRLPSVHAVGGYSHHLDRQRLVAARENGEPGTFGRDIFGGDLVVTMPLFTGGRIANQIQAAELLEAAAGHRLARSREELIFNVTSVFYGILSQRQVIESLEFSAKALGEHLERVQNLIAAQKAARVDQLRMEVRVADLQQRLARERNVLAIQTRVLANMMGVAAGRRDGEPVGTLETLTPPADATEPTVAQALAGRADCQAARAALEAQAKAVDAARAGHWPTVALQGAYGGRWAAGSADSPSGTDRAEDVGRVGIVVDVPVFDGGLTEARVREQRARLAAAQERLRKLELQVRLDIESATLNIAAAAERIAATEKAIEQAKESLRIEQEKHDLGKGSVTDVLDAQSALLDSQTNYYRALADHHIAVAQLKLATGKTP